MDGYHVGTPFSLFFFFLFLIGLIPRSLGEGGVGACCYWAARQMIRHTNGKTYHIHWCWETEGCIVCFLFLQWSLWLGLDWTMEQAEKEIGTTIRRLILFVGFFLLRN